MLAYRPGDGQETVYAIRSNLVETYGRRRVVDLVGKRLDRTSLRAWTEKSDVLLVLIGPNWLRAVNSNGARRIDRPDDKVRVQVEVALAAGLPVVPILLDDVTMPKQSKLPVTLQE
jgi:hypothetical protein